jgi:hypothetical protein
VNHPTRNCSSQPIVRKPNKCFPKESIHLLHVDDAGSPHCMGRSISRAETVIVKSVMTDTVRVHIAHKRGDFFNLETDGFQGSKKIVEGTAPGREAERIVWWFWPTLVAEDQSSSYYGPAQSRLY